MSFQAGVGRCKGEGLEPRDPVRKTRMCVLVWTGMRGRGWWWGHMQETRSDGKEDDTQGSESPEAMGVRREPEGAAVVGKDDQPCFQHKECEAPGAHGRGTV